MNWIRITALIAALGAWSVLSIAQQPAAPPAATPPAATPPPATAGQPPAAARAPVNDDEFIPSQELQADEQVTFPVDI
jgi:ribosomal protein L12E/L44/L45/RPP1/RPP2